MNTDLTVGVVGATGYAGGELCRLLLNHPRVHRIMPTARHGEIFEHVHPNLLGSGLAFNSFEDLRDQAADVDVVFFCTPSGTAMKHARHFLDRDCRVIDVSADFRFPDPDTYKRVYGAEHTAPDLLDEAVYGVTELHRDRIVRARLVANPGCYVITAILALTPVLRAGWADLDRPVHISAVNGTTGAGRTPVRAVMHAEALNSMLPYSLDGHRHAPELETHLATEAGRALTVDLSTAHGNFARGIHAQVSLQVHPEHRDGMSRDRLVTLLTRFYQGQQDGPAEPFVRIVTTSRTGGLNSKDYGLYPRLTAVTGSNFCHIGADWDGERGTLKLVAVTDNLIKGAAGSAIQNMNVMLGLDETYALTAYGL
ncbi:MULTISPECIES: N-acetyl-gamma-glutamyl-phosphate reductase [unclassified Streptomyces]|uniref:N-acetyl-gamma-glutamyl-phosphate reductase n=1 Tax=unclassified Streptomyces TaxID=2593676 RepID=UPI0006AE5E30|nr:MULTISPECIES: N-acetyl-gamma-glutamyl-phosphate reductase [unclassified Streptomyces]KOX33016.1 N-acetyl-gamma-glutamyl-phosphate reductase [Streptomyces sp. NRRL F-6491]KOX49516.1 N-acetyl-gamma-glutamyl-phosphate reductase [Streptomyces sp. NRRL F-6492]